MHNYHTATVLYAVRINNEDWQEEIITTNPAKIAEAKQWAINHGYNRFRVATIDLDSPPDFVGCINQ